MIRFRNEQIFLITGASSGIGRSTALLCNQLGGTVIATGRDLPRLEDLKHEAEDQARLHLEPRDLTADMEDLPAWITELRKNYGKLSGFVHCAGYNMMAPFCNFTLEDARKMFDVHFHAAMLLARGVADRRNHAKECSLVFMGSICAVTPLRMLSIYAAAKGAVISAARAMSKELGTQGVRVNCVSPALVRTPLTEKYSNVVMGYDVLDQEDQIYPLGISEPEDIANTLVFLLSSASRKITGQNIVIDGGRH